MPSVCVAYSMYVLGRVESNWTWNSATLFDGVSGIITIGMIQEAGSNAATLLQMIRDNCPDSWGVIEQGAPNLANDVNTKPLTWNAWSGRVLTAAEAECLNSVLGNEECIGQQQDLWQTQYGDYLSAASTYGLGESNPKTLVYFMSMYHQSPSSAMSVLATAGGNCDLLKIHQVRANDGVLGNSLYNNRYSTVYSMLSEWDGESEPPDFGQVGDFDYVGSEPGITEQVSKLTYIMQVGNDLYLYGTDEYKKGVRFIKSAGQTWVNATNRDGTAIDPGGNPTPGDPSNPNGDVVDFLMQYVGQWTYVGGGDRWTPWETKNTDCSGMVHAAFWEVRGVEVGTWTGEMYSSPAFDTIWEGSGQGNVPWDEMEKGDILLSSDTSPTMSVFNSHVQIYTGSDRTFIHTYSTTRLNPLVDQYIPYSEYMMVRRAK